MKLKHIQQRNYSEPENVLKPRCTDPLLPRAPHDHSLAASGHSCLQILSHTKYGMPQGLDPSQKMTYFSFSQMAVYLSRLPERPTAIP